MQFQNMSTLYQQDVELRVLITAHIYLVLFQFFRTKSMLEFKGHSSIPLFEIHQSIKKRKKQVRVTNSSK